ncbi:piggyBac transposable element-derived protein 3-like [Bactrocera dorsalis]|uniref:PiggyBac transposable element-derived protein 3-like n=1 Tax=Bactrocera dorsalis TaxID=27457 RepID=A0ABM3JFR0_BACDO|nr:piggyBac transposable element-derived protein 3-like [Bactrocera dorsalis]
MGCMRLGRMTTFWNTILSIELFKNTMSLKRFRQLRLNLHFIDNLLIPPNCNDKFFKIRPLIETIRKRCQEEPVEEDVCIDEQIIPFKGKLSCKIYQEGKPNPWGIKNYVLCGKSGFPYEFELYQGKNTNLDENLVRTVDFSSAIVLHLCKRLTKSGHNLYFDNFFNSYNLLEILSQRNINAAGTARVNRFGRTTFVSDKDLLKQGRGSSGCLVSTDGKICIVKWLDNKPIYLASNFVAIGEQDVAKRFCKMTKETIEVKRPKIMKEYNESKGGVDLLDQLISYYRIFLKPSKWILRITSHFIDFALVSSWILYKKNCNRHKIPTKDIMKLHDFRMKVANRLVLFEKAATIRKRGRPMSIINSDVRPSSKVRRYETRPQKEVSEDRVDHFPAHDGKTSQTRCKNIGCRRRTYFICTKCKIHLCVSNENNCFLNYHKSLN